MKKLMTVMLAALISVSAFAGDKREDRKAKHQEHFEKMCERFKDKPEVLAILKKYRAKHEALREQMHKELEALKASKKKD